MSMRRDDERGLSTSVQAALLFPFALGLFLALLQWGLVAWAESSALAAAQQGASVAARLDAAAVEGHAAALGVADNGSLTSVTAHVERGARETRATVTGRAVVVLWPREVSKTIVVNTERVTRP